jgi:hypothetical protein
MPIVAPPCYLRRRRCHAPFAAAVVLAVSLGGAACRGVTESAPPYELPTPDASLDPAALREGRVLYRCGGWLRNAQPAAERVLVDVLFGRRGPEDPPDRPLPAHLARVRAAGGRVLHEFQFPAVRAYLPTRNVRALTGGGFDPSVHEVADPRRYDWRATAGYRARLAAADEDRVRVLGGRVERALGNLNMLVVTLPDRSYPALRAGANVEFVEASGQTCPVGEGAGG